MDALGDFFFSEKYCFYRNAAAVLGTLVVGRLLLRTLCDVVSGFRAFFLAPMGLGRINLRKYGSWAVVTGASEGIGRGYALELARQGLNVVLMSRSEEKLNKVAADIKKFGREALVIPVDFSGGMDIYTKLSDQLKDLDIGVLVNNVGHGLEYPDLVDQIPAERLYNVVRINCQPVVQMSRILLPKMVAKGGGVVVNISSGLSLVPFTLFTVYSASKEYINFISEGMRKEYEGKGIVVQNVIPFFVATAMTRISRTSFTVPGPVDYAKAAVATIGIQSDTCGCFSHALQRFFINWLPAHILDGILTNAGRKIKARFLHKQAQEKKK